jgi:hypothetical protein
MRNLIPACLALTVIATGAVAQPMPGATPDQPSTRLAQLEPAAAPSVDDATGEDLEPRLMRGANVRDAAGHLIGRVARIVERHADHTSGVVMVRDSRGMLRSVTVESLSVNGDAWLGGPQDLTDPKTIWY